MTRRYLLLFFGVLVLGAALSLAARSERLRPRPERPAAPAAPSPRAAISLRVKDGAVDPPETAVPLGARVSLEVANAGAAPARIALAGYGGHLPPFTIPPGGTWSGEFTADLPGEAFAWLVDDRPAGRLAVAGSHLIEGHR